jgi:hypothetical protein
VKIASGKFHGRDAGEDAAPAQLELVGFPHRALQRRRALGELPLGQVGIIAAEIDRLAHLGDAVVERLARLRDNRIATSASISASSASPIARSTVARPLPPRRFHAGCALRAAATASIDVGGGRGCGNADRPGRDRRAGHRRGRGPATSRPSTIAPAVSRLAGHEGDRLARRWPRVSTERIVATQRVLARRPVDVGRQRDARMRRGMRLDRGDRIGHDQVGRHFAR